MAIGVLSTRKKNAPAMQCNTLFEKNDLFAECGKLIGICIYVHTWRRNSRTCTHWSRDI